MLFTGEQSGDDDDDENESDNEDGREDEDAGMTISTFLRHLYSRH